MFLLYVALHCDKPASPAYNMAYIVSVFRCWLKGVLPLVIDRETTLSEKCMETLEELVLQNIVLVVR